MTADTSCRFPRERLVAYHDGDLRAAQLEIVEAHLAACPDCRAWLAAHARVVQTLRAATPRHDDAAARALVKTGVEHLPPPSLPRASFAERSRVLTLLLVATLLGLGALGASVWREPLADGGSSFTRWLVRGGVSRQLGRGTPIVAPSATTPVADLSNGLELEPGGTDSAQASTRFIDGADGLALQLTIDRTGGGVISVPDDQGHSQIVGVNGRDVLVLYGLRSDVVGLYWTDGGVRFEALVVTAPPGGLGLDAALRVAAALMAVDWSGS